MIKNTRIGDINKKEPDGLGKNGIAYRILVVDDSATMRKILIMILKSEAYEICGEASTGQEAVNLYKELRPDVVTMDINMPEMDGLTSLLEIVSFDPSALVVMATSEGQKETVMEAITKGAKSYIVKPPDRVRVLEKIKSVIKIRDSKK